MADDTPGSSPYFPPDPNWAPFNPAEPPGAFPLPIPQPGNYPTDVPGGSPAQPPATNPGGGNVAPGSGGSPYDNAVAWLGGMANPFYRVTRRVTQTRLTKELLKAARTGLGAIAERFQEIPARATGTAVVPYVETGVGYLARFARGIVGGTALSQVVGLAFPEKLSTTDQFPLPLDVLAQGPMSATVRRMVNDQKRKESLRVPNAQVQEFIGANRGPDVILGTRDVGRGELIRTNLRNMVEDPELLLQVLSGGKRNVVTATAPGFNDYTPLEPITVTARRASGPTVGPRPTGAPSTPQSQTTTPATPATSSPGRIAMPPMLKFGLIGLGGVAGAFLIGSRLNSAGRPFVNSSAGSQTPAPNLSSNPELSSTLPQPGTFALGNYSLGSSSGGYCTPIPRGPRRKCLERAPVAWRSGSRKGKAAGTKCIRYASRRS